jgi:hypothetical protein
MVPDERLSEKERGHLDFEVSFLVRFPECSEDVPSAEHVLQDVLAADIEVDYGIDEELGDVSLGVTCEMSVVLDKRVGQRLRFVANSSFCAPAKGR